MPKVDPVAIVTGAGSGIGRAIAVRLGALGWRVALVGRTEGTLDDTARAMAARLKQPVDFLSIPIDIATDGAARAVIGVVEEQWGRIDALVNNAGAGWLKPIAETTEKLLHETFAVNTFAPALLIAGAWPLFARQPKRAGVPAPCVVNISSMATVDPFPGFMVYGASKCALESFTRSIRNETGGRGVRAFSIAPGAVETPLLRSVFTTAMLPPDAVMEPDVIAKVAVECILGERDDACGEVIRIPGPTVSRGSATSHGSRKNKPAARKKATSRRKRS